MVGFTLGFASRHGLMSNADLRLPFQYPADQCIRAIWDTFQNGVRSNDDRPLYPPTVMNPFFNPGTLEHLQITISLDRVNQRTCRAAGEVADGLYVPPMQTVRYLKGVCVVV